MTKQAGSRKWFASRITSGLGLSCTRNSKDIKHEVYEQAPQPTQQVPNS